MMPQIQEVLHKLEVGTWARGVRVGVGLLALAALASLYSLHSYRNLSDPVAMDAAQVARHLADGEGFTTRFIRPLSIGLLERRAAEQQIPREDAGRLRSPHPDLANPPIYPLLLAGALWVFDPSMTIVAPRAFEIYGPDQLVVWLNLALVIGLVGVTYGLAARFFDGPVAVLSAVAVAGSITFWGKVASGQPLILGALLMTGTMYLLALWDEAARGGRWGAGGRVLVAALIGVMAGLCGLTLYGLLLLAIPLALLLLPGWLPGRTWGGWLAMLAGLMLVVSPWLMRNYQLSGKLFGTASATLVADTLGYGGFDGDTLERSLQTDPDPTMLRWAARRVGAQMGRVLQDDLPGLGGSWVSAFFLAGLFFRFANPTREVLRGVLLLGLLVLLPVQAVLGPGAQPGSVRPGTDYLLVLAPLLFVLGTAFFLSLLDHIDWEGEGVRQLVIGLFIVFAVLPMALNFLRRSPSPMVYPPYSPPMIQVMADWLDPEELVFSDVPWAVAWYGGQSSIWLTRWVVQPGSREDFFAINDDRWGVKGLYLTRLTTDEAFFSSMKRPELRVRELGGETDRAEAEAAEEEDGNTLGWPEFVLGSYDRRLPSGFPLTKGRKDFAEVGQLLLLDLPRWDMEGWSGRKNRLENSGQN